MSPEIILLVLVLLACPVAMLFLHRGWHRAHHHADDRLSLTELHRLRACVDREIAARRQPQPTDADGTRASP